MRLTILTTFIAVMTFTSCTQNAGYKIKGNIQNLTGKIYLVSYEGKQQVKKDSTEAKDGVFTFSGTLPLAQLMSIESANDGIMNQFFLDNSEVTITGNTDQKSEIITVGSPANDLFTKFKAESEVEPTIALINENLNSPVAAYILFRNLSYRLSIAELEDLSAKFTPEVQKSIYLEILNKRIEAMKRSEVGQPYMEIALPTPSGEIAKLSTEIESGKYVFIDFWASWCGPCRRENPHVVAAFNEFKDKGFTVFGVSLDRPDGKDNWVKAIEDDNLTWTQVSDLQFWNCAPAALYGVNSIPSNFLISPDGVIVGKNLYGDALPAKLKEIFGTK